MTTAGTSWLAMGAAAFLLAAPARAQEARASSILLPSEAQRTYLATKPRGTTRGPAPTVIADVVVKKLPPDSWFAAEAPQDRTRPLRSANELLILLDPSLTGPQIEAALKDQDLALISTAPQIGLVTVDATARLGTAAVPATAMSAEGIATSPLSVLARKLAQDKRFVAVTPNTVVSPFGLKSAIVPTPLPPSPEAGAEQTDWGVSDAKFDEFWDAMTKPFVMGVVDVGFAKHEDLTTRDGLQGPMPSRDHGNHVSGIMCARHNGLGMKGALKDCLVVISAGQFLLTQGDAQPEGEGIGPFKTSMGEYVGTLLDFMELNTDVKTINMSLGYNWMPNFGIDPRLANMQDIRNGVRDQGQFFARILAYAKRRDIALVSAAGNDSSTLATPLEAKWASPFNFGNELVRQADGWTNGLVVEAHDRQHNRAKFSNSGGQISCPGVDITSTLASSPSAYGKMSGTSMASPYCAAGLAALRALRPELSLRDAIDCVTSSPDRTNANVPRLNLHYAIKVCKVTPPPPSGGA